MLSLMTAIQGEQVIGTRSIRVVWRGITPSGVSRVAREPVTAPVFPLANLPQNGYGHGTYTDNVR